MSIQEAIEKKKFSRRSFLKGVAALYASTKLSLCGNSLSEVYAKETSEAEAGEEWKNAPCWHNCGGTCCLKAQVKNGTIVRLKTDSSHEDSYDYPQQRACVRGLAEKAQIVGAERLKYPMKRTHYDPKNGKIEGQLRGIDTWERISWDEALDLVADQIKSAYAVNGGESVYVMDGGETARAFSLAQGYIAKSGSRSKGCWNTAMEPVLGHKEKYHVQNDRYDLLNAKLIILWGCNPAQNAMGMPLLNLRRAKEAGAKIICIDPTFTRTAAVLADYYYPIRPATDTTLLLALSYIYLQEDAKGNKVIDWDFLNNCTIGFDADHMPEGAPVEENYKDYVLGTYDNEPKTPEWASKICGIPVEDINAIATMMMDNKPTTCLFGWNSARVERAHHVCLAQMALGALTGNIGIPGGAFAVSAQEMSMNGGPKLVKKGKSGITEPKNPVKIKLCTNHHWSDIVDGQFIDGVNSTKKIDVRMMYFSHAACLNQTNNVNKGIEAIRKMDCVVTNHYTFTPEAQFSDIVLPVTTPWEKDGEVLQGNREMLIWSEKVIEPYFESKDDAWIAEQLATRLGVEDPSQANPMSNAQRCFNIIASSTVVMEDGKTYENLVSVTEEDLQTLGVTGTTQEGRVPILELKKKGIYQVERHEGDNYGFICHEKLRKDPVNNPLKTESGKLELYCSALKAAIDKKGWNVGYAYAKYDPPTEGYEATFVDNDVESGKKGEYPYQLYAIHDLRGTHSVFNQVTWLREAFSYELEMNTKDAKDNKLKEGDIVEIYNSRGSILRKLHITERVMPGVLVIHEGVWVNLNKDGKCIAGSPNVLTGDFASGPDVESWNAVIANVKKASDELVEDWQLDLKPSV